MMIKDWLTGDEWPLFTYCGKSQVRPWVDIKLPIGWLCFSWKGGICAWWSDDGSIPDKRHNKGRWLIGSHYKYWRPFQCKP